MVSVIIATYNWSTALKCAIKSVLNQIFQDFEILVIGDCCTDDTEEVVASFNDNRIKFFNLPENSGSQGIPNNKGIELASGEYVAYLGHDDLWLPNHLKLLTGKITGYDIVYSHTLCKGPIDEEGEYKGKLQLLGSPTGVHEREIFAAPSSIMHKKDLGFWKDYRKLIYPPDQEFLVRAWDGRKKFQVARSITVIKFNAAWRKDAYKRKECHEQAACLEAMSEPDFIQKEIRALHKYYLPAKSAGSRLFTEILDYLAVNPKEVAKNEIDMKKKRGAHVEECRKYKGV